jgi:tRNA1Val (adenine37-N6)-methyltransferase
MSSFHFKYFSINQSNSLLKVGTDAMILGSIIQSVNSKRALDIGAGTGVISLMVAQKNPNLIVDAIEIDCNSFIDLETNFKKAPFSNVFTSINDNFFEYHFKYNYDLIFSNPPYYEDGYKFESDLKSHFKHAVNFSKDHFFERVSELLQENGFVYIIVPFHKLNSWIESASHSNLYLVQQFDIEGKPNKLIRAVLVFSFHKKVLENFSVTLRNEDGFYTDEYVKLTHEFHNKTPIR